MHLQSYEIFTTKKYNLFHNRNHCKLFIWEKYIFFFRCVEIFFMCGDISKMHQHGITFISCCTLEVKEILCQGASNESLMFMRIVLAKYLLHNMVNAKMNRVDFLKGKHMISFAQSRRFHFVCPL